MTPKTIFISTGEVSGDLQGALLIDALKRQAEATGIALTIVALGGAKMAQAGATLLADTTSIGSVGILESLPFIVPTFQIQQRAKQYLRQHPPDLVVLIDYMEPNLSIGRLLRRELPHVPIAYYIAPQEWAWSARSILPRKTMAIVAITDRLLAVFPEEAQFFAKKGASVSWVGHPLVDRMQSGPTREEARAALGIAPEQTAIALVPASRRQEIKYMLPVAFEAAQQLQAKLQGSTSNPQSPTCNPKAAPLFWIPLSLDVYRPAIEAAIERYGLRATLVTGQTQKVLAAADLAITKSGTVNLELALLNVPQVVFYRVSPLTSWLGRLLQVSIPFMAPPNLVLMRSVVPELLQEQATPQNIVREALELLVNAEKRTQTLAGYQDVRQVLGNVGVCDRAAREIFQLAASRQQQNIAAP